MTATITLDICTPEGKTWLAEIVGTDKKFGFDRQFVNAVERNTSRSGKTGSAEYLVEDGTYESNEGRRNRGGRKFWAVDGGEARQIDRDEALLRVTA